MNVFRWIFATLFFELAIVSLYAGNGYGVALFVILAALAIWK